MGTANGSRPIAAAAPSKFAGTPTKRVAGCAFVFTAIRHAIAGAVMLGSAPGCLQILDVNDFSQAADAGSDRITMDVREADTARPREAGEEAGKPGGAAVAVASDFATPNWCALTVDGEVECWGENADGELGDGTTTPSAIPKVVGLPVAANQISMGWFSECALLRNGSVWCWGDGSYGQLGNGKLAPALSPVQVSGLETGVISVSAGYHSACCVKDDGSIWCWGAPFNADRSDSSPGPSTPVKVAGLTTRATSVSVGFDAVCAVLEDGGVVCWGAFDDPVGELGNGTTGASATPVPVTGLTSRVSAVSVGGFGGFVCALTTGGAVKCWGEGFDGYLGNGQFANSPVPVPVSGLSSGVSAIATGNLVTCAVREDRKVVCWGYGDDGALGDGTTDFDGMSSSGVPVEVKELNTPAMSISAGRAPCAVTTGGEVACWGLTCETSEIPVPVSEFSSDAVSVSMGGDTDSHSFACGVSSLGVSSCWGDNDYGQLGNTTTASSATPVQTFVEAATAVSASQAGHFACAIQGGTLQCWGENDSGQLGNGTVATSLTPVPVMGVTGTPASVSAGGAFACALTTAGSVFCWGDNTSGQLGNGSTMSSSVAVPVPALAGIATAVSAGKDFACALLADATVDCWGDNDLGQLGNGSQNTGLVPTPVEGLSSVTVVAAGWMSACAVAVGGVVECWGDNTYGEVGGKPQPVTSPVLLPSPSLVTGGASQVAVGATSACAVLENGEAECWGCGPLGEEYVSAYDCLGFLAIVSNTTGGYYLTGVTDIAVGYSAACAVSSGAVLCWGYNSAGQLGNGGTVNELIATPVSGFP